jgi:hypothetical protein
VFDSTNESRAALYLQMARKMGDAAERAADPQVAATYLELAAKWMRLAEVNVQHGDNDDLPAREDDDHSSARADVSTDRHA